MIGIPSVLPAECMRAEPRQTSVEAMKRILFVDDEEMVLQGLQRMLRSLRREWDMTFVESGAKALELMAEQPFDVVVSDMLMPGMTGAELLNEVMKRYPRTVRLILSGHADISRLECADRVRPRPLPLKETPSSQQRWKNLPLSTSMQSVQSGPASVAS